MGVTIQMVIMVWVVMIMVGRVSGGNGDYKKINYGEALTKSILFFEGQRSGKLPSSQRLNWRKDSALHDGDQVHVNLVGGYYDAGDNIKFNFPMAYSTTILAWSVLEFGKFMGSDLKYALEAVRWGADYLLRATSVPGIVYVQVGDPYADHNCWERPEDMDTPRTVYAVSPDKPGSEVSAEIAAALAATSIVFKYTNPLYSAELLNRSATVFNFADKYQGSYSDSLGQWVCPFYCDYSGYKDELIWAASWLHWATNKRFYWNYVVNNIHTLESKPKFGLDRTHFPKFRVAETGPYRVGGINYEFGAKKPDTFNGVGNFAEFGWDSKNAGINIFLSKLLLKGKGTRFVEPFQSHADKFICTILPESPSRSVQYSPGGLLFKSGGSNMQHPTALSFLLLVYARNLNYANKVINCGNGVIATPSRLIQVAKSQVDYILGNNPLNMSYMVGYGEKFPQRIHHRGSSIPSVDQHEDRIECKSGTPYFESKGPNPNLLVGAVVGGPDINDAYADSRSQFVQSEPTTYINAPFVGLLAYFKNHPLT